MRRVVNTASVIAQELRWAAFSLARSGGHLSFIRVVPVWWNRVAMGSGEETHFVCL